MLFLVIIGQVIATFNLVALAGTLPLLARARE